MEDGCVLCGLAKSSGHALWDCWMAETVWKESKLLLPRLKHPQCEFIDVIWKIWEDGKEIDLDVWRAQRGAFGRIEMQQNLKERPNRQRR